MNKLPKYDLLSEDNDGDRSRFNPSMIDTAGTIFVNDGLSRFTFYMLGIGLLLTWNALMAGMQYFKDRFPGQSP